MATIDMLPSGKVRVRLVLAGKRQSRTFETRKEAEQFASAAEGRSSLAPASSTIRFDAYAKQWFFNRAPLVKPSTSFRYKKILNLYLIPNLGFLPLDEITPAVVRGWQSHLASQGLSPATIKLARTILSMVLEESLTDELIEKNPVKSVPGVRLTKKKVRVLSEAEIESISAGIRPRWRAMILVAAYGGLRIGELCGLRTDDLDLDARKLTVAKTVTKTKDGWGEGPAKTENSQRTISLPKFVARSLEDHAGYGYSSDRLVFTGSRGGRLQPDYFRKFPWSAALQRAELTGVRFHDLRHTAVSLWIREGASPNLVAYRAGHGSVQYVLDTYGHLFGGEDDELAARLDAGRSW